MAHLQNLLQWNCRSIRQKVQEITYLVNTFKPIIFAISETWLRPGSNFRISGYACLRDDRSDGKAGCALLINRSFVFQQIPIPSHSTNLHVVAIKMNNITYISIYIPHPNANIIQELEALLSQFITGPCVILGDFNVHHTLWGSHHCDNNSSYLLDLLDRVNLCIVNDGSSTRRVSPIQNPSVVDLTLASPSIISLLTWKVLPNSYGSDHFPLLISIESFIPSLPPPSPLLKYNLSRADWNNYSLATSAHVSALPPVTDNNFSNAYNNFVSALLQSANDHIPMKNSSRQKVPSPPWWDSECTLSVRQRKAAENCYSRSLSMENYLSFQKISASCKRLLSKKKFSGWRSFCESLSPRTPAALVWKKIKNYRRSFHSDMIYNNTESWLHNFINNLAPPFVPSSDCFPSSQAPSPSCNMDGPFSFAELHCALDGLMDSAPGIDGIPYSFITKSSKEAKLYFLEILNFIYTSGMVPDSWRTQIVIPILKPGKNPDEYNSYRPIALSSVLAKIFEHLIKNRLEWILENKGILSNTQFGFRRGLSTQDSLSIFTTATRVAFSKKEHLVGVFLDISAAYDNVQLPLLRQKMLQLSLPARMVNIICNLYMHRSISVKVQNGLLPPRCVWKGLPQGSVLSPLLYNVYTYNLDKSVDSFCNILQYADDIVIYASSCSLVDITNRLNSALSYLSDYLQNHGLSLSINKCNAVVFSRKNSLPVLNLHINNQNITIHDKVKFLGVILDRKLSGVHHLNYICNKCENGVNVMRALSGVRWRAHPYNQKLLYNAMIRSNFDYGTFLIEPCNKLALKKLDKLQSKALRIITGAMKSSPINALQAECLEPPLYLRRQFLSDRFYCNIVQFPSHLLLPILSSLADLTRSSNYWSHKDTPPLVKSFNKLTLVPSILKHTLNPLFQFSFDSLIFQPRIILDFGVPKNSPHANEIFNDILHTEWSDWTPVFTDASKLSTDGDTGAAVWIPKFQITLSQKLPPQSSVFTGEAVALLEAITLIFTHKIDKTIIFSDSLSCLQDISKPPFHSKNIFYVTLKIKDLLYQCHLLNLSVVLAWIPGHSGIKDNEIVDGWAKQSTQIGSIDHYNCHTRDLRSLARPNLLQSWSEDWNASSQSKGRHYKALQPTLPTKPWFFKVRTLDKILTSTIIRLRLGHVCTPVFLAKLHVRDHSLCECGLEDGTLEHIFFVCRKIVVPLYDLLPKDFPRPVNINFLLTQINSPRILVLAKFLKINNIKL